ncbi:hypothetical protein GCK72_004200 [Caenorhabditis remanei]|uniref:F-box domain-containing protein n=1 Tax=Caenorhabditis remanei TaxID=31234 RepID=A0A6A5HD03_CAERE|nr:hypothetical protein GCK72_004200 [Caenorhabditis remanei]KAF1764253.1 hypothetical protein GCK72_004200 [Caenorhabditis remanei]
MSLSFPKLPSVVQLEVLKQLELQQVFMLSLCSEKMKRVVQYLIMKPTNLVYKFLDNGVSVVAIYDNSHNRIDHYFANVEFVAAIPSDQMKPMKLGGNTISYRCIEEAPKKKCSHTLHYFAPEEVTVLESLQRHMKDLFRFDTRVQLLFNSLNCINMSRIINDVRDTDFILEKLDTEQLENYLTIHPGQDSLVLETKLTGPLLRSDSKLCSIKGLAVQGTRDGDHRNPGLHFSELINNFGGEYLFFIDVVYDVNDWAQLIRRWKSKEAYHNLKYVDTTAPTGVSIPFEHTMQQFDFVEWDGQRRPRTFNLDPKIIFLKLDSSEEDCSEWMDIQQDGDGKWASIMLSQKSIYFAVWD